jgi:hypothetical protein
MTAKLPDSDLPSSGADRSATGPGAETSLADEAVLSALGLLEASDQSAFDQALAAADDATRAAIRDVEASWAVEPAFRSRETPDPTLRTRVLHAVRRDMVQSNLSATAHVAPSEDSSSLEGLRGPLQGLVEQIREQQESSRRFNSAPWLWRAASLTLAAGLLVSAWFQARMSERVAAIAELSMQRQTDEQLRALIGPGLDRFLAGRTRTVGLGGVDADVDGAATLLLDPEVGDGFLLAFGLAPQNGPYVLRAVDGATSTTLLSFEPESATGGFRISADRLAGVLGGRFEILDAAGSVILRSA